MASKYQFITGLYESALHNVTAAPAAWTAFLRSACRNYKCRFDEQILIYAQRPDATAVLETVRWNNDFGRWVNRNAKGIAVFDDRHSDKDELKHYFDISDTHGTRFERPLPIWSMRPEFEADVIETLKNSFGELEYESTLAEALISAAKNAAADNLTDYLADLRNCRCDSLLEELDNLNLETEFRAAVQNSVAYMLLIRCGIEPALYFEPEDFRYIGEFNTRQTAGALGIATSDIAETCLREIAATALNLQRQAEKQNRTFASRENPAHTVQSRENRPARGNERSFENDGSADISNGRRSPRPEPDHAGGGTHSPWQIRVAPREIPETTPPRPVPEPVDSGDAERASGGDRTDGYGAVGTSDLPDGAVRGRDGGDESGGSDEVGGPDERHQTLGGGNDTERPDIRLKPTIARQLNIFGEAEEEKASAFSVSQQIIDEALTSGGNEENSALRIAAYFAKDHMTAANAEFLRKEYRTGGKGFIFGGHHVSVWFDGSGIRIATGDTVRSRDAVRLTWEKAARRVRELLNLGRFMPQSELDKVRGNELLELSEELWYLRRDVSDKAKFDFIKGEISKHDFPGGTARIAQLLAKPEEREKIYAGLSGFAAAFAEDNSLLRLRSSASRLRAVLEVLTDLQYEPLVFTADESVSSPRPAFITQDELDALLTRGGQIQQGKFRIYSYFLQDHSAKEKAAFLKKEYGVGGFTRTGFIEWHDSKGIAYSRENNYMPYDKVILTWPKVARRIDGLIADNRYMSGPELEYIPEYEKNELAKRVYSFYPPGPEHAPRPFPYGTDFPDGVTIIRPQLDDPERVAVILEQMAAILEGGDADRNMRQAYSDLTAYQKGEFSLFTPADKSTDKSTEEAQKQPAPPAAMPPVPAAAQPVPIAQTVPAAPPVAETAEYDLRLGAAVYLGIEEYEILSFDADLVVLLDPKAPLFTRDMPRAEFERKLRENSLNDTLIKKPDTPDAPESKAPIAPESEPPARERLPEPAPEPIAPPDAAKTPAPEIAPKPQIGDRYEIQGRFFVVDGVDSDYETVSLRDVTFEAGAGFPIFRQESFNFIRMYDPIAPEPPQTAGPVEKEEPITPAWEKEREAQRGGRVNVFDPHPEIPQSERHNYRITDDDLGAGGAKTKYRGNTQAIRTLQTIERENRFATPAEQEILAHYVGWGSLPQAFSADNKEWANEYAELTALLSPEEYDSARATTLNAHYTSPTVIKAIYKAVENMGFRTGNILEPSCGAGNFFGLLPEGMAGSKLFGVEIDSLTGRIARQLYQKNSIAIQGFEKTELPDSFFDLAIGNVPFGDYGVSDKRYDKHKFHIHDYFFAKTLDKVRPGGIIAFVTSKGTMDKRDSSVRKYIAQRADLLGAIRLPRSAFSRNAGTEVTADIIFLQKRDHITDIEPDWVHRGYVDGIGADGEEAKIPVNSYFEQHPDMILGTMSNESGGRMYGGANDTYCVPFEDTDLAEQLAEAITNIHADITEYERDEDEPEADNSIPADPSVRNYSYALFDGQIYYRQDSRMVPARLPVTAQSRVRGLIEIRECVRDLIMYQTDDYPKHAIAAAQSKLNRLYDNFTKKYGLINSRGNSMAFSQDSAYCLLCSLEVLDENGELERKADMFTKRTIKAHVPITRVDTATEALAASMGEKARVDLAYMSELTGMSEDALKTELEGVIFLNIGGAESQDKTYVTADEYLSGNIREKLAQAKAAQVAMGGDSLNINVKALEAAMPEDLSAAEISVRLGATWIPEGIVQQFVYELLQTSRYARDKIKIHYSAYRGEWNITEKTADRSNIHVFNTYGTQRISAYKIIEDSLNLRDVRVWDKVLTPEGDEKRVLNKKETAIAQAKQEIIRSKFEEWIWKDPERRDELCRIYNDKFNSIRPRVCDGSHLTFPGMNPEIKLRRHQVDAIAHILYGGNTLLAHEVGAGKTFEMVAAAMESKRIGLCEKSLIVVPNHITEQWAAEFLQLYPSANILVAKKKDFETKNRKKFCARIATGDYDAVIIGHSQFEKIPMSAERQEQMLKRQISELLAGIDEVKRNRDERFTIKQMERMKKSLEVHLESLNDQSRKDDVVSFEELGIDRLFIDEAHYFKNLYLISKMRSVGGITQGEAQKSSDLFMKTQYLDEITGGRGTVFATGTPISNSLVELYTMQRYLQYKELVKHGLQHFDAWASTFGETVTAIELAPEGTGYRNKTRFAKFYNLPELMSMFRMVADIQTGDMLNLPVPKASFHNVVARPSEWQKEMVAELAERADIIRRGDVDLRIDNMLRVTSDGRKLALDQRLINPLLPDGPGGKVSVCAENVFRIWEETKAERLTQLVFSDLSTPKPTDKETGERAFNVYDDLKQKLIAKGVPEGEIAFIHDANTEARKAKLFAKVRKGEVRVLIGSTQKMGTGTNAQDKLIALHDLDCPWRPSDLAQRLGRIVRQGNKNPAVEVFRYVTESTFDSYIYQLVENKQRFIAQIMTGKTPVRMAEDIDETALSYAEIKALATGNPLIIEKAQLESDVSRLKILHASHLSQKYALEDKILKEYPREIKWLTERIAGSKADAATAAEHPARLPDEGAASKNYFPPMMIGGIFYAEKAEAGQAIIAACKAMTSPESVPLGSYRGFDMTLSFDAYAKEYILTLKGALSHEVRLGGDIHGNIARLDNAIENFGAALRRLENSLVSAQEQLEAAKGEVDRPFAQENEYREKSARLKELDVLLRLDEKDSQILETEPDERDAEASPREKCLER
jgi:N12 class adenine-specific DNA methylase